MDQTKQSKYTLNTFFSDISVILGRSYHIDVSSSVNFSCNVATVDVSIC